MWISSGSGWLAESAAASGGALIGSWCRDAARVSLGGVASDLSIRILNNLLLDLFVQRLPPPPPLCLVLKKRLRFRFRFRVRFRSCPGDFFQLKPQWKESHATLVEFHIWEKFPLRSTGETRVFTLLPQRRGRCADGVFSCLSVVLQRADRLSCSGVAALTAGGADRAG